MVPFLATQALLLQLLAFIIPDRPVDTPPEPAVPAVPAIPGWRAAALVLDEPLTVGPVTPQVDCRQVVWRRDETGLTGALTVAVEGPPIIFAVALVDAAGRPLAALTERLSPQPPTGRRTNLASLYELTCQFGAEAASAARFVVQVLGERPPPPGGGLPLTIAGASSVYSESYAPRLVLDGQPGTCWASATGRIADEWLLFGFADGQTHPIAGVGLNPNAEPGYPNCSVKDFHLLVSTTGVEPADFTTAYAGVCEHANRLQTFTFAPVEARWVKLLCRTNRGDDKWVEIAEVEVYPATQPAPARVFEATPVQLVDDFENRPVRQPTAPRHRLLELLLLERDDVASEREGRLAPPAVAAPGVDREGCVEGAVTIERETEGATSGHFGRLTYNFGNLLGGAPQWCLLDWPRPLADRPTRLQFSVRTGAGGNSLLVRVVDAEGEWFLFSAGRLTERDWWPVSVDLDPARATRRGTGDGVLTWPLQRVQLGVAPRGRDGLTGQLDIDDVLALSPLAP